MYFMLSYEVVSPGAPLAGAKVAFALANANGRLKVLQAVTDASGLAEAEYRAGTQLGTVTVTAAAEDWGVTASVQIVFRTRDTGPGRGTAAA